MKSDPADRSGQGWGPAASLGLGLLVGILAQVPALALVLWRHGLNVDQWSAMALDGPIVVELICISTPIQVALLWLLARRTGLGPAAYLGLRAPGAADVALTLAATLAIVALSDGVSWVAGREVVSPFQRDLYRATTSAGLQAWLWITVVVAAPVGEETLFRGFLFRGLLAGSRHAWVAIVTTALLWAVIHVQYDSVIIAQIFACGIVLGWLRWRTDSIVTTMLAHALLNAASMAEVLLS